MGLVKFTQEQLNSLIGAINNRAKKSDVYTKSETESKIAELAPVVDISGKADKANSLQGYGITDAINSDQKGAVNGVPTLGADGKVPAAQIPAATPTTLGGVKVSVSGSTLTITTT